MNTLVMYNGNANDGFKVAPTLFWIKYIWGILKLRHIRQTAREPSIHVNLKNKPLAVKALIWHLRAGVNIDIDISGFFQLRYFQYPQNNNTGTSWAS